MRFLSGVAVLIFTITLQPALASASGIPVVYRWEHSSCLAPVEGASIMEVGNGVVAAANAIANACDEPVNCVNKGALGTVSTNGFILISQCTGAEYFQPVSAICPVGTTLSQISGSCEAEKVDPIVSSSIGAETAGGSGPKINHGGGSCAGGPSSLSERPIHLATGNKFYTEVDFSQSNVHPLHFIRYYNSYKEGDRWTNSYSQRLIVDAGDITVVNADNKQIPYTLVNSEWVGPSHRFEVLEQSAQAYKLTFTDRREEVYSLSGQLTAINFPNGISHAISYVGSTIEVARLGETLSIIKNSDGQVSSIITPDGGVYQYAWETIYGISRLVEVIYPDLTTDTSDNPKRVYEYHVDFPSYIVKITDGADRIFSDVEYDQYGRAIRSGLGNGISETKIEYLTGLSRKITNTLGKESTLHFTEINGQYFPEHNEGHASTSCLAADQFYTYDSEGLLDTTTDAKGVVTSYDYNARGLPTLVTAGAGTVDELSVTTQWHPTLRLPKVITENGRKTTYEYYANGNLESQTIEDLAETRSRQSTYTYNVNELLETIDGPRTDVVDLTTFTYDVQARLETVTNPLSQVTTILDYNDRGQPTEVQDANGVVTGLTYHPRGWLLTSTLRDPSGNSANDITTTYEHNASGNVKLITLPSGEEITFEYDTSGRLEAIENEDAERIEYILDLAGNRKGEKIKSSTGEIKKTLTRIFDELGRVKEIHDATRLVARYQYDKNNNLEQVEDGRSYTADQSFDALNRPSVSTDALTNTSFTHYDDMNRVDEVTDQRGLTTGYLYDAFNNLEQLTSPDTGVTTFTYDDAGNQKTATDARNVITTSFYDELNRLTRTEYSDAPIETVVYDYDSISGGNFGKGELTGLGDEAGYTYFYYDHRGLLTEKAVDIDSTIYRWHYGYDANGKVASMRYPSGRSVRYVRDNLGRIDEVYSASWEGAQERLLARNFDYQPFGGLHLFEYGNGVQQTVDVDDTYRLTGITSSGNSLIMQRGYDYDLSGNVNDITDDVDSLVSQLFNYDPISRLDDASGGYGDIDFNYDPVGNRTDKSVVEGGNTVLQTLDSALNSNRVLSKSLQTFGYDNNGNIVADLSRGLTLDYNQANRLNGMTSGGSAADYVHNGFGQRVIKTVTEASQAETSHYQYADQAALIFESDEQGRAASEFIFADGLLLALMRPSAASDTDSDGLDDDWELQFFGNLNRDSASDFDGDGFSDTAEFISGTLPNNAASTPGLPVDSDKDGLRDTWELSYIGDLSSNGFADSDNDGILDRDEYLNGTDPSAISDQDNDGLQDEWEIAHFGSLGQVPSHDFDLDGVSNQDEYLNGTDPTVPTDSDEDGLPDYWEIAYFGNLSRSGTGDFDSDGLTEYQEWALHRNPLIYRDGAVRVLTISELNAVLGH